MFRFQQVYPASSALDVRAELQREWARHIPRLKAGARIAVGVGSRGITRLAEVVREVIGLLKEQGAQPFIIPAMGSHGGATPEGQTSLLADYGVTEASMGAPIKASLEVQCLGTVGELPVWCSREAMAADGIVVINRVKPHTDFLGIVGSGVLKMLVIGLGKRQGAAACHGAASRLGLESVLRQAASVVLAKAPVLAGVALVENQRHDLARLAVLSPDKLPDTEPQLMGLARSLMPQLPFQEVDLLIVDELGKNISGSGLDPNVTGRWVHGYSTDARDMPRSGPRVRRLFVRGLTPETHGNAIGLGLADVTTTRVVQAMDKRATYINSLTSLSLNCAKVPIHFDSDAEAIEAMIATLALDDLSQARVLRIRNTLNVEMVEASAAYLEAAAAHPAGRILSQPAPMSFDPAGNLSSALEQAF